MAKTFVQVNIPTTTPLGKKLLAWTSVEGADTVYSEGVTLADSSGNEVVLYPETLAFDNGGDVVVGAIAVPVLAANPVRKAAVIQNIGLANIRIGVAGVTSSSGLRLMPGEAFEVNMPFAVPDAIWAIREGGADSAVAVVEAI
jgi:hypothetical protein